MNVDLISSGSIGAQALARSQQHYDVLLNGLAAVIWEMDAETLRLSFTSRNIEALFSHPYERWVQDRDFWVKRLHPEDRGRALEACTRAIAQRRPFTLEYRMLCADGRALWIRDLVTCAKGPEGRHVLRGVMVEITESKAVEEVLKRRIAYLEARLSESSPDPAAACLSS